MKRPVFMISLIAIFVGVLIVSISSFFVPDPLHSVNIQYKGILHENEEANVYLSDVQRRKNVSLYITSYPEDTILNARILNPRANLVADQNLSSKHHIDITPTVDGNYTATIQNLNKDSSNIDIFFASSVLFHPNGTPKFLEINIIKTGVTLFILGTITATFAGIFELLRKYRKRQYRYS